MISYRPAVVILIVAINSYKVDISLDLIYGWKKGIISSVFPRVKYLFAFGFELCDI